MKKSKSFHKNFSTFGKCKICFSKKAGNELFKIKRHLSDKISLQIIHFLSTNRSDR